MRWFRPCQVALVGSLTIVLGCGGGGGGSSSGTTTPPPPVPRAVPLTLKRLAITGKDVLVQTKGAPTTLKAGVLEGSSSLKISYGTSTPTNISTMKLINGLLASLNPVVTSTDGTNVTCDLTKAEVTINKVMELTSIFVLIDITYPNVVNPDCSFQFKTEQFIVASDGTVYSMKNMPSSIVSVISAEDVGFNTSGYPIVMDSNGVAMIMKINLDGTFTFKELGTSGQSFSGMDHRFATNGDKTVLILSQNGILFLTYSSMSLNFTMTRFNEPYNCGIFIDSDGDFITQTSNSLGFYKFDLISGELTTKWDGILKAQQNFDDHQYFKDFGPILNLNGKDILIGGRFGTQVMSGWCNIIDIKTGQYTNVYPLPLSSSQDYYNDPADMSVMHGQYAYCATRSFRGYSRYDAISGNLVKFDTDTLGVMVKSYIMTRDSAIVEVVNASNSDKEYIELNFNTGVATKLGVISQGGRTVVDVLPTK